MRIPSDLHGESLYGRKSSAGGSQRGSQRRTPPVGGPWRRVIRLSLVLVLVLIAMRQAAQPGVYRVFFPEPPRQIVGSASVVSGSGGASAVRSDSSSAVQGNSTESTGASSFELTQGMRDAFDTWVETQTNDDLAMILANWLDGEDLAIRSVVSPAAGVVSPAAGEALPPASNVSRQAVWALMIQRRLILSAKDGSVWRAADGDGLAASLAMHDSDGVRFETLLQAWPTPAVAGVLPLLQQPEVYQGRTLIASGELVRIERIRLDENAFGVDHYFNLWLLPKDDSRRPWMVIVPDLPREMSGLVSGATVGYRDELSRSNKQTFPVDTPRPSVSVAGEFIKRLSYQSESGAELTPVLVGHLATLLPNGNPFVSEAAGGSKTGRSDPPRQENEIPIVWVLVGSGVIGLLLAILIMWRTAVQHRHLRQRRANRNVTLCFLFVLGSLAAAADAAAQSLIELLPGYDSQRLSTIAADARTTLGAPNINVDELAKLVFRIDRLSGELLVERLSESATPPEVGDAVEVDGRILDTESLTVSSELQEYIDIDRIAMIVIEPRDGAEGGGLDPVPRVLFSTSLPNEAAAGDLVSGIGVRMRSGSGQPGDDHRLIVDVAGRLKWTPAQASSAAEEVLSIVGVDLSRLADIRSLDRLPLTESDSAVFYPMVGAARIVSGEHERNLVAAVGAESRDQLSDAIDSMRGTVVGVSPVDLLRNPDEFTGHWIRLDVETIRITRVSVQSEKRRREVGGEFYYEIDAIGDLGNVQLLLDVAQGEPVRIENRYPVTIISPTLPEFLRGREAKDAIVINRNTAIRVEGFFYRLWGYESDFMQQRGSKQFAPLLIAGVITDRTPTSRDPLQVAIFGKIAAVSVVAGIVAALLYFWFNRRGDVESRKRRHQA